MEEPVLHAQQHRRGPAGLAAARVIASPRPEELGVDATLPAGITSSTHLITLSVGVNLGGLAFKLRVVQSRRVWK